MKKFEFYISAFQKFRTAVHIGQDIVPGWTVNAIRPSIGVSRKGTDSKLTITITGDHNLQKVTVTGNGDYFEEGSLAILKKLYSDAEVSLKDTEPFCEFMLDYNFHKTPTLEKKFRVKDFQEFINHPTIKILTRTPDFTHFTRKHEDVIRHTGKTLYSPIGTFVGKCPGFENLPEFVWPHSV